MCGISAIVDPGGGGDAGLRALRRMHDIQQHRGPDGEGCLFVSRSFEAAHRPNLREDGTGAATPWVMGLAVRRLRVQDTAGRSDQPVGSNDGRTWVALNGEIYNHRELRDELGQDGARFRTSSDTEVVLAAYERWGRDAFERFDGMWALLIVDVRRRLLVGSRDRLGIKPLFYAWDDGRLLLGSEPQAVATVMRGGPRIDAVRFPEFLRGRPPHSSERSYFEDVEPVPPASVFELDLSGDVVAAPRFRTFWSLPRAPLEETPSFEQAVERLSGLLTDAVERQARADVPVGTLLSGGLDSSTLTSLLAATRPGSPAFSIAYEERSQDESGFVDEVLRSSGAAGRRVLVTPATIWSLADAVIRAQGQPVLGWEVIAQNAVYRLAREHGVVVILDGQGPDEMLGGYAFQEGAALREPLKRLRLAAFYRDLRAAAEHSGMSMLRAFRTHVLAPMKRGISLRLERHAWLETNGAAAAPPSPWPDDRELAFPSDFNRLAYQQVRHTNLPVVLQLQDRNSMAHSVESRVPYLDHRVVELCFRLPADYKYRDGVRKRLLRSAARDWLPRSVWDRREKRGLMTGYRGFPLRQHAESLRAMAHAERLLELPWIRRARLTAFVEGYLQGRHDDMLSVWRLFTAWRWLEAFTPGPPRHA